MRCAILLAAMPLAHNPGEALDLSGAQMSIYPICDTVWMMLATYAIHECFEIS